MRSSSSARRGTRGPAGRARPRSGSVAHGDGLAAGDATDAPDGAAIRSAAMRIGVLSDIHSNLPALEAVLAALGPLDAVWHLGDVVGYGPHPDEVVTRLREIGAIGVRGNHDAAALGGSEVEMFNPDARVAIEWTARRIAPPTRAWLRSSRNGASSARPLVHGSPPTRSGST